MKIIDVAEFYSDYGGGVKTYIEQKLDLCRDLGVEASIVAPGSSDAVEKRAHGTVYWVKSPVIPVDRRYHIFAGVRGIHQILNEQQPDVVEGSSPWLGGKAVGRWHGPAVKSFIVHQDPVSVYPQRVLENLLNPQQVDRLFSWFWRYMGRLADQYDTTVVAAPWLAARLESLGINKTAAVPFGIDKDLFSPALRDEVLRRQLLATCGIDDPDASLFVTISRHHPEKRLGTMIKAFKALPPDFRAGLYIIGDGPTRRTVERQAKSVPHVHVAGRVSDRTKVASILASADAMVHCGAAETFGLVIAEALCSGLPLVVPNRGGAYDLAAPEYSETHRVGDATSCRDAMIKLMARDKTRLQLAAKEAGRSIRTPRDHFAHLFEHYATLLSQRGEQKGEAVAPSAAMGSAFQSS